uniref:ABC-transporter n=1 Tax=consortium cosmid clone pGZ1 TaxID=397422 RepID=Q0MX78_9BACT|nr:ABC-transporter [consortium cosmid clone pGZ1]
MNRDAPGAGRNLILSTLLEVLRRHRRAALLAALLLVLAKVASVAVPLVLKEIVDRFTVLEGARTAAAQSGGIPPMVAVPVFILIGYSLLRFSSTLFVELRDMSFVRVTLDSIATTAERTLLHLLRVGPRFHSQRNSGALLHDVNRGTAAMGFLLGAALFTLLPTLVEILGVLVVMIAGYSLWFTAIILTTFGVYAFYTFVMTRRRVAFERMVNALGARAEGSMFDSLLNYEAVKVHVREQHETRRYSALMREWGERSVDSQYALSRLHLGQGAIIAAGVGAIMLLAGDYTVRGIMTVGDLVLVNAYVLQICMPLNALGFLFRETRDAMVDIERLSRLLQQPVEPAEDPPHRMLLEGERPSVRFENVEFGYEPGRPILQGVSFTIEGGTTTAVVGGSGSGKSTLARLLLRMYEPDSGKVLIGGTDARLIGLPSLRGAIGVVPQDTVLFNDTIAYNIGYGRPGASPAEIIEAARAAQLHELIESLPQKYETAVGERGLLLSGGERQRLAIARALLKDPPILVFDEATSALDTRAERAIQGEIDRIAKNRTTLIIAHRLSTIVGADEIIVLDRGRIVERGRHEDLLSREGLYAQLWNLQQQQLDVERTERRLARQPLNIGVLLAGVLDGVRSIVDERAIQIFTNIELENARITGDPSVLSQALWDMCLGAIQATPDGGRIEWSLSRHDGHARLVLVDGRRSDTPAPPADGARSADPLQLRSVFERHGGHFALETSPTGHGTRYVVDLPMPAVDPVATAPRDGPAGAAAAARTGAAFEDAAQVHGPRLADVRVIVVDDLADAREAVQLALEHEGADVRTFARGADALAWLEALAPAHWPDVFVCDIALGDEDGHDVVRSLRHMEARLGLELHRRLPAIALTGMARPEDRLRALMAGFQVHLAKPVRHDVLVATIARLTRAAPGASGSGATIESTSERARKEGS